MSFIPSDRQLLWDIVNAGRAVQSYAAGRSRDDLDADTMRTDAIIRQIQIVGEASRQLSQSFRSGHADVPWSEIIGMRNRLIHGYQEINLDEVWRVVTRDIGELLSAIEALLEEPPG